jgi:hypothetical protein
MIYKYFYPQKTQNGSKKAKSIANKDKAQQVIKPTFRRTFITIRLALFKMEQPIRNWSFTMEAGETVYMELLLHGRHNSLLVKK